MSKKSKRSLACYLENISIPGTAKMASENKPRRFSWLIAILCAMAFLSWQLYFVIDEYREYRANTIVKNHAYGFQFPDVTICKLRPFSSHKIPKGGLGVSNATRFWKYALNWTSGSTKDESLAYNSAYLSFQDRIQDEDLLSNIYEHIHSCEYHLHPCHMTDFKISNHPLRPNCVTFSPKNRNFVGTEVARGLNIVFGMGKDYIQQYPKREFALDEGYEVMIHEKGTLFEVNREAVRVRPWSYVNVFLRMKNYTRISTPISKCKDQESLNHLFTKIYQGGLRQIKKGDPRTKCNISNIITDEDSLELVQMMHLSSKCRCFDNSRTDLCNNIKFESCYGLPDRFFNNLDISPNGTLWFNNGSVYLPEDREFRRVVDRSKCLTRESPEQFLERSRVVGFPQRCMKTLYTINSAATSWPLSKPDMIKFLKKVVTENSFIQNKSVSLNRILAPNENFSYLAISPSNLNVDEVEEYLAYPVSQLASDFGGTIGLWIGCCFLTIIEVFEMFINIIANIYVTRKKQKNLEFAVVPTEELDNKV